MDIKRFDFRILFGAGLILLGGLILLEKLNILRGASSLFWGALLLIGAAYFLQIFFRNPRGNMWAVFPGAVLLGMGASAIIPSAFQGWGGAAFLGAIGLGFWAVYFTDRARWWAIIPGGVLFTLAVVTLFTENDFGGLGTASVFFIGLGLTFLLVAMLPNPFGKMEWAYIPAGVMVVMGALLGTTATKGLAAYVWPAALIVVGLVVLLGFFIKKD